jgi:hypothetical protein
MMLPALIGIITPIVVGLILGVAGVLGLLAGSLASGLVLAIMMNNSGGAWDNAKKFVEAGNYGGKGSEVHKATVVGDTVGDPFKDTAGPSINILIKLMSMVSIVFAGLIVAYSPIIESTYSPINENFTISQEWRAQHPVTKVCPLQTTGVMCDDCVAKGGCDEECATEQETPVVATHDHKDCSLETTGEMCDDCKAKGGCDSECLEQK